MSSIDETANNFIGRGLTFPITLVNGKPTIDSGRKLIEASLRDILAWVIGTRYFLGEYGGKLEYLLQEPDNGVSAALLRFYTAGLINNWEKRVDKVNISIIRRAQGVMVIKLDYRVANTKIIGSFIYPYYSQLIY